MPPVNDWALAAIAALTPVIVAIIDWFATKYVAEIPSWVKPILATTLGAVSAWLSNLALGDPVLAALVGLAAVGVHQIITHLTTQAVRLMRGA